MALRRFHIIGAEQRLVALARLGETVPTKIAFIFLRRESPERVAEIINS